QLKGKARQRHPHPSTAQNAGEAEGRAADVADGRRYGRRHPVLSKEAAVIRTALALAARGFHVFPCRPRDKRPSTTNGHRDATTDPLIIRAWWHQQPDNNIAIATGEVSGIFVVDVDGLDAEAGLRRLEAEHGALPAT